MTLNLYIRKKLFQAATLCKVYADRNCRKNYDTRAKIALAMWAKLLDLRDMLR